MRGKRKEGHGVSYTCVIRKGRSNWLIRIYTNGEKSLKRLRIVVRIAQTAILGSIPLVQWCNGI